MSPDRQSQIEGIRKEVENLTASPLYPYRRQNNYYPVIGEGSLSAQIVFIGEAPGENEAKQGRPFAGAAGRVLDEMLLSVSMKRSDVYITNIVNDRPPDNRDPSPAEIALYGPFLIRQLQTIAPKIIATLGRFSMQYIFEHFHLLSQLAPISKIHGQIFEARTNWGLAKIIPLYHPAVVLYQGSKKQELLADFKILQNLVK